MPRIFLRSKIRNREKIDFFKKLALLTAAGMPLSAALDSAASSDHFKAIAEKVKSGGPFSAALDADIFPPSVIGILSVSEKSGALPMGLKKACQYMEKNESFKKKIAGSLVYPAFVLILCFVSLFVLVSVLLPSFAGIFRSMGIELPFISRFILDSGKFIPLFTIILAILAYLAFRYIMSDKGFRFPVVGGMRSKMIAASFFSSMGESLSSGMSLIDSLTLSAGLVNSVMCREKLEGCIKLVYDGNSLSESLQTAGLFDGTDISLISAGQLSSSLDRVFAQLAEMRSEEIENDLKTFSGLVEPISTLATGLVVGAIIFAMFMPILKLISALGS
jgi:type II secretory pathway component PulF